jgi:hypothetical protein
MLIHYLIHFSIALSPSAVTNKMTAGAKSFGSFFTGVVNKAGAKIKETVKDNVSRGVLNEVHVLIAGNFSRFSASSTRNRKRLSRISRARVVTPVSAHGSATRTRRKSRRKSLVYRA